MNDLLMIYETLTMNSEWEVPKPKNKKKWSFLSLRTVINNERRRFVIDSKLHIMKGS